MLAPARPSWFRVERASPGTRSQFHRNCITVARLGLETLETPRRTHTAPEPVCASAACDGAPCCFVLYLNLPSLAARPCVFSVCRLSAICLVLGRNPGTSSGKARSRVRSSPCAAGAPPARCLQALPPLSLFTGLCWSQSWSRPSRAALAPERGTVPRETGTLRRAFVMGSACPSEDRPRGGGTGEQTASTPARVGVSPQGQQGLSTEVKARGGPRRGIL